VVEDIYEIRKEKLMSNLKSIDPETPVLYLSNAGSIEINTLRPAFTNGHTVVNKM
jgi:hypothetical protein